MGRGDLTILKSQIFRPLKITIPLLATAIVLIIVALVLRFSIVPGMKQLPDDVDTARYYEGTLNSMLNPEALQTMDLANLFLKNVDVDIYRHYTVEKTDEGKALVRETIYMTSSETGELIQSTDNWYAVDRKTLECLPQKSIPEDFFGNYEITNCSGMVFAFPVDGEKKDRLRWVSDFQKTVVVTYVGEEKHEGIDACVFKSVIPVGEIVDPDLLEELPAAIPKGVLTLLAQSIDLPEEQREALETIMPSLPDPVPLKYTFEYRATYWIEQRTGINIDVEKSERRKAALDFQGQLIPLISVFDVEYEMTDTSIDEAIDDANDLKDRIEFWETGLPGALIAIGAVLVLFVLIIIFLKRRKVE